MKGIKLVRLMAAAYVMFVAVQVAEATTGEQWLTIQNGVLVGCSSEATGTVEIPETVRIIANGAFRRCEGISVIIPRSMTSIGDGAFSWCSGITDVIIPNSVTSIGNKAFLNVADLRL